MKIKSITDIITNSSNESYTLEADNAVDEIKKGVHDILLLLGWPEEDCNLDSYCILMNDSWGCHADIRVESWINKNETVKRVLQPFLDAVNSIWIWEEEHFVG